MFKEAFLGRQPSHFHVNPFVKAFIVAETFLWSAMNLTTPIFSVFVATKVTGGNIETAAASFTVYYIFRILFELVSGRLLSRAKHSRKFLMIIVGLFLNGLAYMGFAFSGTILWIYVFNALSGIGLGIASPFKNSLFSTHLDKDREATEWGIYDATVFIGMGLAAALGGFVAERYGFQFLFIASAIFIWVAMIPYTLYARTRTVKS